jgi:hypothetical protein
METPYYQAARYPSKTAAGKAYNPLQQLIHDENCDLSVYRYLQPREGTWYVVIIGEKPLHHLQERITKLLKKGKAVTLDDDTITVLLARRLQQIQQGDWVEGHYGPPDS